MGNLALEAPRLKKLRNHRCRVGFADGFGGGARLGNLALEAPRLKKLRNHRFRVGFADGFGGGARLGNLALEAPRLKKLRPTAGYFLSYGAGDGIENEQTAAEWRH